MAYGSVKVDNIVYDNSGSDASIAVSGIPTTSDLNAKADLASPALTGNPTAPTQSANDNSTKISTTAYVQTELGDYAPLASPALTGDPTAPTQSANDSSTKIATTAYVQTELGDYATTAGPTFTGTPAAPTASANTNTTQIATTAYVQSEFTDRENGVGYRTVSTSDPSGGSNGDIWYKV